MSEVEIYVVLAYFEDGSLMGAETVIAAYKTQEDAERFKAIAERASPMKTIAIAGVRLEP